MATAISAVQQRKVDDAAAKDQAEFIPEIIEERRKDSEGRSVLTKYIRGKLLGKGGFAKCFLGTHVPSNHQYALKIVYKSTLSKSSAKQKLQTEIKIHRTLKHSYIVKFERFFEDNTNVYMVLELCNNNSMSNLLKRRKKLTELECRYYISQLVSALKYLHDNLVIHRDLKLGNLFIDSHMRLKVGDFGLATKISDPLERKKTFCGTPNYIAPEILEGKNGHSFEVDIWSTGVILYTLLVGKPPFESKNVESTYKRILSNSFSFPEETIVCDHGKNLIRKILQVSLQIFQDRQIPLHVQTSPEARPTLDQTLQHSFFTGPGTYIPDQLPESALRVPPLFQNAQLSEGFDIKRKGFRSDKGIQFGDENDPHAANRNLLNPTQTSNNPNSFFGISCNEYVQKDNFHEVMRQPTVRPSAATGSMVTGLPGVPLRTKLLPNSPPYQNIISAPPQKRERLFSSSAVPEKRVTHTNKFEVYEDLKMSSQIPGSVQDPLQTQKQKFFLKENTLKDRGPNSGINPTHFIGINDAEKLKEYGSSSSIYDNIELKKEIMNDLKNVPSSSSVSVRDFKQNIELDQLQSKLEFIKINHNNDFVNTKTVFMSNQTKTSYNDYSSKRIVPLDSALVENTEHPTQAAFSTPSQSNVGKSNQVLNSLERKNHTTYRNVHELYVQDTNKLSPGQTSEPMQLGTPHNQIIINNELKAPCTLETMHEVLSSQDLDDLPLPLKGQAAFQMSVRNRLNMDKVSGENYNATVWVSRYVDYTSKYGLGFLLNTGSAGVYFNDSTKIVVSPDGLIFQYSERKKKEKGSSASEHIIQTHSVSNFPHELQKKVTLLRHFRNYLVDQQKEGSPIGDDGSAVGGSAAMEKMATLEGASSGATPLIPFGKSSILLSLSEAASMGCSNLPISRCAFETESRHESFEMPFLKKWVRTKHAILFRLSNRTVQVLFMDRSEVLLTSEARMVTYVNKQNVRSEHTLEEVLQTGRTDIAKRLKYAKDIMYRLIHIQVR